jgi:hypothetical protein
LQVSESFSLQESFPAAVLQALQMFSHPRQAFEQETLLREREWLEAETVFAAVSSDQACASMAAGSVAAPSPAESGLQPAETSMESQFRREGVMPQECLSREEQSIEQ